MSAGKTEAGKYATDSGAVFSCRPQPETKALQIASVDNAYPTGAVDQLVGARLGGGKRKVGVTARTVTLRWTGAAPDGYDPAGLITVPVFTSPAYNVYVRGATGTYLSLPVVVVGRSPERLR